MRIDFKKTRKEKEKCMKVRKEKPKNKPKKLLLLKSVLDQSMMKKP